MIPKKIHRIWFNELEPYSNKVKACLESWTRVMPDYEVKLWTLKDIENIRSEYLHECIRQKKWALASDYLRAYAVYTEGGIYLDHDVEVFKPFDEFLNDRFFTSIECFEWLFKQNKHLVDTDGNLEENKRLLNIGLGIQAAIFGAELNHPFLSDIINWYDLYKPNINEIILAPNIYANNLIKYGFKYKNEEQFLNEGIRIYSNELFCEGIHKPTKNTYARHIVTSSWKEIDNKNFKLLIAVPNNDNILNETFKSIFNLKIPDGCYVEFFPVTGFSIAQARNIAACKAIDEEFHYIMFIDSDISFLPDTLIKLLELNSSVSSGVYDQFGGKISVCSLSKKDNIFKFNLEDKDKYPQNVIEIQPPAIGMGCCLIKTKVFFEMEYPYFKFIEYKNRTELSEDLYFCSNLPLNSIKVNMQIKCGHTKKVTIS